MQIEALKIFCDVVRWGSFSRGAAENGVSQSSASQVVSQLEARLGTKLIDRSKRPPAPTLQGKIYYEGCKDLIGRYLELENRVKSLDDEHNVVGTVRVASIYSVGLNHMAECARLFAERYPGASVKPEYLHPRRVVEVVSQGAAELGLISFPRKWPELKVIPWREEPMVLALPPRHRFAGRPSVGVAELDGETFVGFDHDLVIRRMVDGWLRRHGVSVKVALEFDNIENIKRAVEVGAGIAILPEPTLKREVEVGSLAACVVDSARGEVAGVEEERGRVRPFTRPLAIIHARGGELGLTARRFLEILLEESSTSAGFATSARRAETAVVPG